MIREESSQIGVGLIGYGLAGSAFHAPLIASVPGLRLHSVVTTSAERSAQAIHDHPGVRVVASADALWDEPEVRLVVVASPNRTHVPLARRSVEAGIPVVVDKPLAGSADDARALIEFARERGVLLSVYQNRRWDGDFLTLRELLAEGALGEPRRFESRFERWRPDPKPGWRQSPAREDAGGLLFDLGSHLIDQALFLFGPATHVYAELERRYPGAEVDDDSFVALTHANGVRSHLWMSTVAATLGPRFRVIGSRAAYTKHGLDVQEDALRSGVRPGSPGWGEEVPDRWGILGAGDEHTRIPTVPGGYHGFYAQLAEALGGRGPLPVDPRDALRVLEVIEAAQQSAATRSVVAM